MAYVEEICFGKDLVWRGNGSQEKRSEWKGDNLAFQIISNLLQRRLYIVGNEKITNSFRVVNQPPSRWQEGFICQLFHVPLQGRAPRRGSHLETCPLGIHEAVYPGHWSGGWKT
jgi:hypothetical protein